MTLDIESLKERKKCSSNKKSIEKNGNLNRADFTYETNEDYYLMNTEMYG